MRLKIIIDCDRIKEILSSLPRNLTKDYLTYVNSHEN